MLFVKIIAAVIFCSSLSIQSLDDSPASRQPLIIPAPVAQQAEVDLKQSNARKFELVNTFKVFPHLYMLVHRDVHGAPYVVTGSQTHIRVYNPRRGTLECSFEHTEKPLKTNCLFSCCCCCTNTVPQPFRLHALVQGLFGISYREKVEIRSANGEIIRQLSTRKPLLGRHVIAGEQDRVIGLLDAEKDQKTAAAKSEVGSFVQQYTDKKGTCFIGRYWDDGRVEIVDTAAGKRIAACTSGVKNGVIDFTFYCDEKGRFHVVLSCEGRCLKCFPVDNPTAIKNIQHEQVSDNVSYVPREFFGENQLVVGCNDGAVRLFDCQTERELQKVQVSTKAHRVYDLKFDTSGTMMVATTVGEDMVTFECPRE